MDAQILTLYFFIHKVHPWLFFHRKHRILFFFQIGQHAYKHRLRGPVHRGRRLGIGNDGMEPIMINGDPSWRAFSIRPITSFSVTPDFTAKSYPSSVRFTPSKYSKSCEVLMFFEEFIHHRRHIGIVIAERVSKTSWLKLLATRKS